MPKYIVQVRELPNSGVYVREPGGTNQVNLETVPPGHVATFILDQTNITRMAQFITDVNTAITTAEGA